MMKLSQVILLAGLCAGVLDITAACASCYWRNGSSPARILQSVAGGWLGTATFQGGGKSVALGLATHFLIATLWAAAYVVASTRLSVLTRHAVFCGATYGVLVYLLMYNVVLPLSAYHSKPFNQPLNQFLIGVTIHIFCVGLPIALVTRANSSL